VAEEFRALFLILVLFRNPVVFIKAIRFAVICLFDSNRYAGYISGDISLSHGQAVAHGLGQDYPFLEDHPFHNSPAIVAYNAAHVFARTELYKAGSEFALRGSKGRYLWRKLFGPVTPGEDELYRLANVVNSMTGYCDFALDGISGDRARTEQILIFPRYLRCLSSLLSVALLSGGVKGNEAGVLFSCLGAGAVVLYWLFS
jgi:hypothetical protein